MVAVICAWVDAPAADLLTSAQALSLTLTPTQRGALVPLLGAFAEGVEAQAHLDQQAHWQRLLAHMPGLAPMLEVLSAHVGGGELHPCPTCEALEPQPIPSTAA